MSSNIPSDVLPRSRKLILPLVSNEDDREVLLTESFYGMPRKTHQL